MIPWENLNDVANLWLNINYRFLRQQVRFIRLYQPKSVKIKAVKESITRLKKNICIMFI